MSSTFNFASLSDAQLTALTNIAFGSHGAGVSPRTTAVLERHGLIESHELRIAADRFGPIVVRAWHVPFPVHIDFCRYCETLDVEAPHKGLR